MIDNPDPDWADNGRKVLCTLADGSQHIGALFCYDEFFDGEDEIPLFHIELENENIDIHTTQWKYLE